MMCLEPWNVFDKNQSIKDMNAWRIDFAAGEPFGDHDSTGNSNWIDNRCRYANISTDLNHNYYYGENTISGDGVSGDAEELNLLQAGISNLITTTSDMFYGTSSHYELLNVILLLVSGMQLTARANY